MKSESLLKNVAQLPLKKIQTLGLEVAFRVDGELGGKHRSFKQGGSLEFQEHFPYYSGEELNKIDWRVYGRSDRLVIKRFEHEANLKALMALDFSSSMIFKGDKGEHSKLDYSRILSIALGYILLNNGDTPGLLTFTDKVQNFLPPNYKLDIWKRYLDLLDLELDTGQKTSLNAITDQLQKYKILSGVILIFSDFLVPEFEPEKFIKLLKATNNEIILVQVLTEEEIEFPFYKSYRFLDPESDFESFSSPNDIRTIYKKKIEEYNTKFYQYSLKYGVKLLQFKTTQPLDIVLIQIINAIKN